MKRQPGHAPPGEKTAASALATSGDRLFAALLESAPDAIVIVDHAGVMVLVNSQAEKLFGYPRQEMLGQTVELLLPEHQRVGHVRQRREYAANPRARPMGSGLPLAGRRKDGVTFPVEISLSPLQTPGGLLISSIIRDVSERKRAEETICQLNADLERRVRERTAELERAHRELVRADQLASLGQVAAGVAHELRNPLTSIKGLIQVNRREAEERGMPIEDLGIIEQEIRRMERTLQTFLDFARPPKPEHRTLSLVPIVDDVLALLAGRAAKQHVGIIFDPPAQVATLKGDRDQLQQLVLNLILNAFDAMPRGGTLTLRLGEPTPGWLRLDVEDTGNGVPAQLLPRIFEPFVSSKETGLGLGLAVSRRIAEDHAGRLAASNRPEGGACFTLELPLTT